MVVLTLGSGWTQEGQSKPSPPSAYSTTPARSVADWIHAWEQDTKVGVDAEARAQIAQDADRVDLSRVFVPAERHEQALAWTKNALVKAYLYAVWNRDRAQSSLTKEQIDGYNIGDFIGSLNPVGEPFGIVEFLSAPAGATIMRDQQEIGHAPMAFVVSGQVHVYAIILSKEITCESTIQVRPGSTERMTCPE